MEKILLTGATGFIGRHTIPILREQGYDVHGITSKGNTTGLEDTATWHSVDLLDAGQVNKLCREIQADSLMHLAWYDNLKDRMTSEKNVEWVEATLHLARAFAVNGGKRFVMGGSCTEYDWQYGYCNENRTPTVPQSIYGECKASVHKILEKYSQKMGFSYASGRIFFVYGPYEEENRLVAYAIRSLIMKQQANFSHGNQMRDYLHVADVADALVSILSSDISGAINIGSGRAVKLREIVDLVGTKLNGLDLLEYGPVESKFDSPVVMADITKLRDEVGWTPKYDLESGIGDTINWWKTKLEITAA
ncbi:NAD-dependent epimerase/dehydratase family protein [Fodinibius salsisoli]|uniref:NAD(P)-dependent oxidoreductase n=1 Tax=Fodinibius salsisoli TaxID=2820877 RepID=A0ABT3PLE2_9BACT|nr:NAD(P)-dependent oxidoreductase [Fodinibius salsisoli]MCW9706756.1 NAD(P)-dependent oxidoreductase [Fodinibius salsisoli]